MYLELELKQTRSVTIVSNNTIRDNTIAESFFNTKNEYILNYQSSDKLK